MIQIRKILEELVSGLDYTFNIKSITAITGGYRLFTCDTLHLHPDITKVVVIGGNDYEIVDFKINEYIDVKGSDPITVNSFVADPLFFEFGTLTDTNVERVGSSQIQAKRLPFFWVKTPFDSTNGDEESAIGKTATLTFYLLDESLLVGEGLVPGDVWYTQRHQEWIVEPMENLFVNRIEKYIESNKSIFGDRPDYTVRGMVLAGVQGANGYEKTLFDEKLSGIEVRIELEFMKQGCKC